MEIAKITFPLISIWSYPLLQAGAGFQRTLEENSYRRITISRRRSKAFPISLPSWYQNGFVVMGQRFPRDECQGGSAGTRGLPFQGDEPAPLGGPTSVRVLRRVQVRGGGRLDRQLWHRNLARDERVAASQGHAVLAMGPDLQGREGPRRWAGVRGAAASTRGRESGLWKTKTPQCISLEGAEGPHMQPQPSAEKKQTFNAQWDAVLYIQWQIRQRSSGR